MRHGDANWVCLLDGMLPLLGHRNFIVVADSAYPLQSNPGIDTVFTGAMQIDVVKAVLDKISLSAHVRAKVLVDSEMAFLTDEDAPGIGEYRDALDELLEGAAVETLPHEDIIGRLDESGKVFTVLLLKSTMTLPYTTVFFELDCGYWTDEKESRLREAIDGKDET